MRLAIAWILAAVWISSCGIGRYPGHPGVATNSYSKIDVEHLEAEGLYVYETSYDNRSQGKGVAVIVTKLYPGAQTYTSNARMNQDGALYRAKSQYKGALVQMISIPQQNQILIPPGSSVTLIVDHHVSADEVDDRNIAEEGLFSPPKFSTAANAVFQKFELLRAARLTREGNLIYEVAAVELGKTRLEFATPVLVETSFFQNAVTSSLALDLRHEIAGFLESNFPKGYDGAVRIMLKGKTEPIVFNLGLHTPKTAVAAGVQVRRNVTQSELEEIARKLAGDGSAR